MVGDIVSVSAFVNMGGNGGKIIIDCNTFHHSNHLKLLICYTGHVEDNKTVAIVSVAIFVRSYHLMTLL